MPSVNLGDQIPKNKDKTCDKFIICVMQHIDIFRKFKSSLPCNARLFVLRLQSFRSFLFMENNIVFVSHTK